MSAPVKRRGWCPGARRPMETGDGLLVRIHPPGGVMTAAQARSIARAAQDHGNGLLDVTARGNLQIRGVSETTYPALLAPLDALGLLEPEGEGPHRLTVLSPLAGIDPHERFDSLVLAAAIERQARGLTGLPAKTCVAVDGGGRMSLKDVGADLHLMATGDAMSTAVALGLASPGGIDWIGATSLDLAPSVVVSILARFAEMRRDGRSEARRIRELAPELARELGASASLTSPTSLPTRQAAPRAGLVGLGSGQAAVLAALPFGRCHAEQLVHAAEWAERFGNGALRLSFTRGLLLPSIRESDAALLCREASHLNFIVDPADSRLSLQACPGKPACGSAWTSAPEDAMRLALAAGRLLSGGAEVHVSGCSKGCAHPGAANLTLVGGEHNSYGVVIDGSARDPALVHLSIEEIMTRLSALKSPEDLHRIFGKAAS